MADKKTLEALIARAEQRKDDKVSYKVYRSDLLGCDIKLKKPPMKTVLDLVDKVDEEETAYGLLEIDAQLIYEAWPVIKENFADLQEVYEASDPYELILKMFDSNIDELDEIAKEVISFYMGSLDDLKN